MCIRDSLYGNIGYFPGKLLIDFPLYVRGVKEVVRYLASRLAQVSCIKFLDCRILMGLTDRVGGINVIKDLCTCLLYTSRCV